MRMAAILEYDGAAFSGWQRQPHAPSVQAAVEDALSKVADAAVTVTVAGRTDAGVHATAQVIHFDTSAARSPHGWLRGTNSNLPRGIAVLWAREVTDDFHARYGAIEREYRYVILNRPVRPTYLAGRIAHAYRELDIERMNAGAGLLIGTHDFNAYRAAECQAKSPVRELRRLAVERNGETVTITATANAFLHHMVRNIAGVLMTIGAREREPGWAREILESRDRTQGGITAPPDGLYLARVTYPERFGLPNERHKVII